MPMQTGFTPKREMQLLIDSLDVIFSPSPRGETFGINQVTAQSKRFYVRLLCIELVSDKRGEYRIHRVRTYTVLA